MTNSTKDAMFNLKGKTAVVTGASRGIGRNVALRLAEAGADLILWGRDIEGLRNTAAEIEGLGANAATHALDVTDREAVECATETAIRTMGKIDTVVVNAGLNELKPFLEQEPSDWNRMIGTNLYGAIHTLQAVGRHMTERKSGSVITMASIYSFVGAPSNSIYCLTKGGLLQLSKALAVEWSRFNVRVNAICPGWIETALTEPYMRDERSVNAGLRQIPLRRFGRPSDIGPMAVYLASDESQWVTGQSFVIDGGQIAR
ncbi:SDR family NAD(P)-dependent oxidoreductase [Cupriavidus sp. CuC1]|uniref:SDR family NAD(P)-dependent oxidoreductase n=1 Tax=Cupriavidus sp. CuC1 TaxID=3373131 RepID=UPI0037D22584